MTVILKNNSRYTEDRTMDFEDLYGFFWDRAELEEATDKYLDSCYEPYLVMGERFSAAEIVKGDKELYEDAKGEYLDSIIREAEQGLKESGVAYILSWTITEEKPVEETPARVLLKDFLPTMWENEYTLIVDENGKMPRIIHHSTTAALGADMYIKSHGAINVLMGKGAYVNHFMFNMQLEPPQMMISVVVPNE